MAAKQRFPIRVNKGKIRSLIYDYAKSAAAIDLVYVNDKQNGISRIKKGKKFCYVADNKEIKDASVMDRIKSLVIPPAWEQVWICKLANGHMQATGLDTNGRKQYRYHPLWSTFRSETKFSHLYDFGKALQEMRKRLKADISLPGLPREKVLATIVSIMEHTGARVGNNSYEKLYGSFGLTTLKDKHANFDGNEIRFSFKGKKGVYQDISLSSKKLAQITKQCRDIPGKELFQYYDEHGERRPIDSGMVNDYIKAISGGHFTSKDFRTWTGTLCALEAFRGFGCCDGITETKSKVVEALDITAKRLGNTRTVCRKYYVHPTVIECYSNKTIEKYFEQPTGNKYDWLNTHEGILMEILESSNKTTIEFPGTLAVNQ